MKPIVIKFCEVCTPLIKGSKHCCRECSETGNYAINSQFEDYKRPSKYCDVIEEFISSNSHVVKVVTGDKRPYDITKYLSSIIRVKKYPVKACTINKEVYLERVL